MRPLTRSEVGLADSKSRGRDGSVEPNLFHDFQVFTLISKVGKSGSTSASCRGRVGSWTWSYIDRERRKMKDT